MSPWHGGHNSLEEEFFKLTQRHLQLAIYCHFLFYWPCRTVFVANEKSWYLEGVSNTLYKPYPVFIFPQGSSSANTWKLEYVCTLWTLWLVNFLAKSMLWKPAFVHGVVHFKGFSKDGKMHNACNVQVRVDDICQNFMHVQNDALTSLLKMPHTENNKQAYFSF